jgi:hypothetical protein
MLQWLTAEMGWRFTFRRWMTPDLPVQKNGLLALLAQITLNSEKDKLSKSGQRMVNLELNLSTNTFAAVVWTDPSNIS